MTAGSSTPSMGSLSAIPLMSFWSSTVAIERSIWFSLRSLTQDAIELATLALENVRLWVQSPLTLASTALASAPASAEDTSPFPDGDGLIASQIARDCRARARRALARIAMSVAPTSLKPEMAEENLSIAPSRT